MRRFSRQAHLYINGRHVGTVSAEAASNAWGFGHFTPSDEFSQFAPLFGAWAMLIHEDDDKDRPSLEALEELRGAEVAIDSLKTELVWLDTDSRTPVRQLTIDGSLIEWNLAAG